jgi:hypothetical protein
MAPLIFAFPVLEEAIVEAMGQCEAACGKL